MDTSMYTARSGGLYPFVVENASMYAAKRSGGLYHYVMDGHSHICGQKKWRPIFFCSGWTQYNHVCGQRKWMPSINLPRVETVMNASRIWPYILLQWTEPAIYAAKRNGGLYPSATDRHGHVCGQKKGYILLPRIDTAMYTAKRRAISFCHG
ncbi:hypothetical protein ElyMa_005111200 [Elysia marginata]|uniref:Uncharacterized protein n=1 Tax=Elysia marginata TaxID=1093978 RepID=A0AAV4JJD7_9GAST|nr:hypothetical protein ElyMa_005111200 [Elysia marginata]